MSGFIDKLSLRTLVDRANRRTASENLEDTSMEVNERSVSEPDCEYVKEDLKNAIREYLSEFTLPVYPAIYDFLILSLTSHNHLVISTYGK